MTTQTTCCKSIAGCGALFTKLRPFQKACGRTCASRMIGHVTEQLRIARRQALYLAATGLIGEAPAKKKRRRRKPRSKQ